MGRALCHGTGELRQGRGAGVLMLCWNMKRRLRWPQEAEGGRQGHQVQQNHVFRVLGGDWV